MYRNFRILTVFTIFILFSAVFSFAAAKTENTTEGNKENLTVYNTHIVTGNKDATYIEGEVAEASGQEIQITAGLRTIASKVLPSHGGSASFSLKIPACNISTNRITVLYVRASHSEPVRVEVVFKPKEEQSISCESEEYSLTLPGFEESLVAKASSGEPLIFVSENPEVATVDEDGNIVAVGEGSTKISVKQVGNSCYDEAETSVDVSVSEIDAFSVTFHSSDEKEETSKQIILEGENVSLEENSFENGDHDFLGWAEEDGGLVVYDDTEQVNSLAEKGENKDLYAVWTGDGIPAAIEWAIDIAEDDSFTYGQSPQTNTCGCYFCGTNQRNKPKGYEKTYVCMPFITAAYAHGAEDPEMMALCQGGKRCLSLTDSNFKYGCWQKVGLCKNLSVSDLQPGDVICKYSASNNNGHLSMYIGNGNIVDATSGGGHPWGANSIAVRYGVAGSYLSRAARHSSKSYVMRYVG